MSKTNSLLIGQIALEEKLITEQELRTALGERAKQDPPRPLGVILVAMGAITDRQLVKLIDEQRGRMGKPTNYAEGRKEDLLFGKLLVKNGKVTEEQLHDSLSRQQESAEQGKVKRLGEILVESGYLNAEQVHDTLKHQNKTLMACPKCSEQFNVVMDSGENKYDCTRCGVPLVKAAQGVNAYDTVGDFVEQKGQLTETERKALEDPRNKMGKYVLLEQVGVGGFATVYKAFQKDLGRMVAIKILRSTEEEDRKRFIREGQLAAKLHHPNIAPIYEVGEHEGRSFIVMEFVDGSTLNDLRMSVQRAVEMMAEVSDAVHYAHQKGVVHRDIKPANLMVDRRGRLRVMDFGLARDMEGGSTLTATGLTVGTPSYMPPEQIETNQCDERSDVYSLGAALYELLTGHRPFDAASPVKILDKALHEDPISPRKFNQKVGLALETVVFRAMEKNPARRYMSSKTLADDLRRTLKQEAVEARPRSLGRRIAKRVIKNKVLSATIAGLLLTAVVAGYFVKTKANDRAAARRREENARGQAQEREWALNKLAVLRTEALRVRGWKYQSFRRPGKIRREFKALEDKLTSWIEQNKALPHGYYVRSQVKMHLNNLVGAREDLIRAKECAPDFTLAKLMLLRVEFEMMDQRSDVDQIENMSESYRSKLDFKKQDILGAMSDWQRGYGGNTQSEIYFEKRWGLKRMQDEIESEILVRAYLEKDLSKARGILLKAFDEEPSDFLCLWIATHSSDEEEKFSWAESAIKIAPNNEVPYNRRGSLHFMRGNLENARQDFSRAISINPNFAFALSNRGVCGIVEEKYEAAIKDFSEAIRINPKIVGAHYNRGIARKMMGRLNEAIEDYSQEIRLTSSPDALYNRGVARWGNGDVMGAFEDVKRSLVVSSEKWKGRELAENLLLRLHSEKQREF